MRQESLLLIFTFRSYIRCINAFIFYIGIMYVLINCHHKNSAGIENITTSEDCKSTSVLYGMSHTWNSGQNNTMHSTKQV